MIDAKYVQRIADKLELSPAQVGQAIELLTGGAAIPFVARYRRDVTGRLDEQQLERIAEENIYYTALSDRKRFVLDTLKQQNALTPELEQEIDACVDKMVLEDVFLPFKKRKRTKATVAADKGLTPLADFLMKQAPVEGPLEEFAGSFVKPENQVSSPEEAMDGAVEIIAERLSLDRTVRTRVRDAMTGEGQIAAHATKNAEGRKTKYSNYHDFTEPLREIPSHRYMAILRGVKEGVLRMELKLDDAALKESLLSQVVEKPGSPYEPVLRRALNEAYDHLIRPALENDVLNVVLARCEEEAIRVFRENAENILMAGPAGPVPVLGVDPLEKGCAFVVAGPAGEVLEHGVVTFEKPSPPSPAAVAAEAPPATAEPVEPAAPADSPAPVAPEGAAPNDAAPASEPAPVMEAPTGDEAGGPTYVEDPAAHFLELMRRHAVRGVAVANAGSAREFGSLIRPALSELGGDGLFCVYVSDACAAAYAGSRVAREESPRLSDAERRAVSCARRVQDPLAELCKIEPRFIGVGQYQHDVHQKRLREGLRRTLEYCVNRVGVNLATCHAPLLTQVCGMQQQTAEAVIAARDAGSLTTLERLNDVDGVGPKVYEQCVGFLYLPASEQPLDATRIHPEAYEVVAGIAQAAGASVAELMGNPGALAEVDLAAHETGVVGPHTLALVREELAAPGRDPRKPFKAPELLEGVHTVADLEDHMVLEGVVTNVTDFGVFVDVGVTQDGLVHLSELANRFVRDPRTVAKVGDVVRVKVLKVDKETPRISLSIKALMGPPPSRNKPRRRSGEATESTDQKSPRGGGRAEGGRRQQGKGKGKRRDDRKQRSQRRPEKTGPAQSGASSDKPLNTQLADQLAELRNKLGSD